ncbi:MAG: hypothetical protein FWC80_04300, partial [Firmicutes bacterium]|nr:hypothetical protein [Bacillota bacterium]
GRRFRVAPEDGWTQIGLNDAGSAFLPFRTTTNTNGFMPNSSAANEIPPDEDWGDVRRMVEGFGWANLFIVTAPAATGFSWTTPLFEAGESYMITGLRLWEATGQTPNYLITSGLATAITNAQGRTQANYTSASWTQLQATLDAAEVLWADLGLNNNVAFNPAIQANIDSVATELNAALSGLVPTEVVLTLGALRSAINIAQGIQQGNHTQVSWDAFVVARSAAIALYNNGNPLAGTTQPQIDSAITALNNARMNLEFIVGAPATPAQTRTEFGFGTNLISNGNFEMSTGRDDSRRGEPTLPAPANIESPWSDLGYFSFTNLVEHDSVPAMGDINTALYFEFGTARLPHDAVEVGLRGWPWGATPDNLFTPGAVHFFSAWVRAFDTPIYFDIAVTGGYFSGINMYDLGRRFRVAPEDGWVQIGVGPDGNFLPFRTNGEGTRPNQTTASRDYNANENVGNAIMQDRNQGTWQNLVIATFSTATGFTPAPSTGGYMITGMRLWQQGDADTSVLGALVNEANNRRPVYTPETWAPYAAAVQAGRQLLWTENPSQAAIDSATTAIIITRDNLAVGGLYVAGLRATIDSTTGLNQAHFTTNSWTALQSVLTQANELWTELDLDDPPAFSPADQDRIDDMEILIGIAISSLVNIQAFTAVIAEVDALNQSDWNQARWLVLQTEVNRFRHTIPVSGTAAQVAIATREIQGQIDALFSNDGLYQVLDAVDALDANDFTANSWAVLMSVVDDAEAWLARTDADVTQAQMFNLIVQLEDAILELVDMSFARPLRDALAVVDGLNLVASDWTIASWTALETVVAEANAWLAVTTGVNHGVGMADIMSRLETARLGLVDVNFANPLIDVLTIFSGLNASDWTTASWTAFSAVVTEANAWLDDATDINYGVGMQDIINRLLATRQGLVAVEVIDPNFADPLIAALIAVDVPFASDWTVASFNVLYAVAVEAQEWLDVATDANYGVGMQDIINRLWIARLGLVRANFADPLVAALVSANSGLVASDWTVASWNAFVTARNAADAWLLVATNPEHGVGMQAIIDALWTARLELVVAEVVDPNFADPLKDALAAVGGLNASDWTVVSWNAFNAVVVEANVWLTMATNPYQGVGMQDLIYRLFVARIVLVPTGIDVNFAAPLEAALVANSGLTASGWTVESWDAFETARNAANAWLAIAESPAHGVGMQTIINSLWTARLGLTQAIDPNFADSLVTALASANAGLNASDWTETSWNAFVTARNAADAWLLVATNPEHGVGMQTIINNLWAARLGLIAVEVVDPNFADSLRDALASANAGLNASDWTVASWNAFVTARNAADAWLIVATNPAHGVGMQTIIDNLWTARLGLTANSVDCDCPEPGCAIDCSCQPEGCLEGCDGCDCVVECTHITDCPTNCDCTPRSGGCGSSSVMATLFALIALSGAVLFVKRRK